MAECTGWLLDIYPHPQGGLALWLVEKGGAPRLLRQPFPVTFYAAGPGDRLRLLWRFLQSQPVPVSLSRLERRDLFQSELLTVLSVQTPGPLEQETLFQQAAGKFPDLTYYDADISAPLRHAAQYGTFPLARLRVTLDERESPSQGQTIQAIQLLDTPWELDPEPPPLRILEIEPDCDPRRAAPIAIKLRFDGPGLSSRTGRSLRLSLQPVRPLLINLAAILKQYDPDLIQTAWGDTWLLPCLLELSQEWGLPLPLNRHTEMAVLRKREHTYFSYGQVIHRGQQVLLYGRWHIDIYNAMMFHDYGLDGVLESARVTSNPVQTAARLSPGSGISAMQVVTALRSGVLVPWHKQQAEQPKSALDLMRADQGGLVYQPLVGLHRDVAEVDFISMYPSIMARFNVSPETVMDSGQAGCEAKAGEEMQSRGGAKEDLPDGKGFSCPAPTHASRVPALGLWIDQEKEGLIPRTLAPLLAKRIALKTRLAELPRWDPRRPRYKACSAAHKWLLVTCFGYLGYKNARFGRIEAHEAVTAYSRECLLRAKEAAEELGFTIIHMYVDGLWVQKPGSNRPADIQPLLDEIVDRTGLPIALEGIYRWVAFLPSKVNPRVPVANRYFGVFQDGSLKVRGIEARRRDAPPFVAQTQMRLLELLSEVEDVGQLPACLPGALAYLAGQLRLLRQGRLPLEDLVVTQKLSRELERYRSPSPAARAAAQLAAIGKPLRAGQAVRFIYTRGRPGVHAWDLPEGFNPAAIDIAVYRELLLRAAAAVLQPLGVSEELLHDWVVANAAYLSPPGRLSAAQFQVLQWSDPCRLQLGMPRGLQQDVLPLLDSE